MTVADIVPQVTYLGNGATTDFSFTFESPEETDLIVNLLNKSTLEETYLTLDVDYSVDLIAGEVTYPLVGSPLASTHAIVIQRRLAYAQAISYGTQGVFSPTSLEEALDYVTMLTQQLLNVVRVQTIGFHLPVHTVAGVPSALNGAPALIYVRDASGGGVVCFSDGTNWRRIDTRAIVS